MPAHSDIDTPPSPVNGGDLMQDRIGALEAGIYQNRERLTQLEAA